MEYSYEKSEITQDYPVSGIKGYPGGGNTFGGMDFEPKKPVKKPEKKRRRNPLALVIAAVAICVACAVGGSLLTAFVFMPAYLDSRPQTPAPVSEVQSDQPVPAPKTTDDDVQVSEFYDNEGMDTSETDQTNVEKVADYGLPGVVSIYTFSKNSMNPNPDADDFSKKGFGSGFIIDESGYIVTNYHVIASSDKVQVMTFDGTTYDAEVVAGDNDSDIALLKVDAENLHALKIGNSDACRVGQMAIAIGNPIGENLVGTVTVGYISNLDREVQADNRTYKVLQTDAAINPGNSGGPLFNIKGEVIGMTTLKSLYAGMTEQGTTISTDGIGFAIPINYVMDVISQLKEKGVVEKPGIGITYYEILEQESAQWNVPQGWLVTSIIENGPSAKAGIKENDIITKVDGHDVMSKDFKMAEYLKEKGLGAELTLTVWRNLEEIEIKVEIADINSLG